MTDSRSGFGKKAEDWAIKALRRDGMKILDRNVSCPLGELDVVGLDGEVICFVEVKGRSSPRTGTGGEAVTLGKRRRIARLAQWYRKSRRAAQGAMRFDVVEVWKGKDGTLTGRIIKGAFAADGRI